MATSVRGMGSWAEQAEGLAYRTLHGEGTMAGAMAARGVAGTGTAMRAPGAVPLVEVERFIAAVTEWARRAMVIATRRRAVRQTLHHFSRDHAIDKARSTAWAGEAPAVTFTKQLVRLWRAGSNLNELLQLAAVPSRAVLALAGEAPRALRQLDLEEQPLDGVEDQLQLRRNLQPLSPASLREEAVLCDTLAATYSERSHALHAQAAQLERTGGLVA